MILVSGVSKSHQSCRFWIPHGPTVRDKERLTQTSHEQLYPRQRPSVLMYLATPDVTAEVGFSNIPPTRTHPLIRWQAPPHLPQLH